jgi:vacuolar-type H+-ATPase subunit C/Vma6
MIVKVPVRRDLDFLAARLHGRRSRLAEGPRLDELCRIRTTAELGRLLGAPPEVRSGRELQRWLIALSLAELTTLAAATGGAAADLLAWQRVRFQAENLKVLARGFVNGLALDRLRPHLAPLPEDLELDAAALAGARSHDDFVAAVPCPPLRQALAAAGDFFRLHPRPFILETALDAGYLRELLRLAGRLPRGEREPVRRLAAQEADIFHLMLAARGRFHYDLPAEMLAALHVPGSAIDGERFATLLAARDLAALAAAAGRVLDEAPPAADAGLFEVLAWNRFLRLANAAFRRSHHGVGAVIGYTAIRRIELANLITLAEGMRLGLEARVLRGRLIPRSVGEAAHV